ncbi:excinuclease ABC subunit B [Desulfobotulus alkaliphilus]|uniref:UvrABC system protein B n=1 Tax=Desulfobotulus alkaliphilus TaxID=622671 RepID=A0A562RT77_9BACT|nr:excinuclease ABC subunit UvrB [Desulfobotulus alkaliphilus]TWI72297.1 excinuclease ABC subunit B [Desulfobotulus alkaliphilus]
MKAEQKKKSRSSLRAVSSEKGSEKSPEVPDDSGSDGDFHIVSAFEPKGDQPAAIDALARGVREQAPHQVLLGVTGSGKTFTMAHVIAAAKRPALIIAPNKTLAAQLFNEFRQLFPHNAVEYFVSYYDYYQPEAYIPSSDTYIAKDSAINEMIDKMRHSATRSVLTRRDVIVVASVSCIYGLGAPEDYLALRVELATGQEKGRDRLLRELSAMQYTRSDLDFHRGTFRVRGDRVEIFPAYEEDRAVRVEFFGDEIEGLAEIDPLRGEILRKMRKTAIFPGSHYVTEKTTRKRAVAAIEAELKERIAFLRSENRLVEAQRIEERTNYDLEMLREIGYCTGIENYSRHLTGRNAGEPPPTLFDYFPDDLLIFFDESHIAVPQVGGMYKGDRSRKETLVNFGFRLPSALDNRPLRFPEFEKKAGQVIYVSATPADYETERAGDRVVEQIVRPTGLVDPPIEVRSAEHQVDDLYDEIKACLELGGKVLVTTLTKRMAEDLTDYYTDTGIRVRYLHSDISTLERIEIIQDLRMDRFDVLVGINLLREGLDIPEVALVAILDADKEGFLRSARSLIQTCGRAARNVHGRVIMYADRVTPSMAKCLEETGRRRSIQQAYNETHGITPESTTKAIASMAVFGVADERHTAMDMAAESPAPFEVEKKGGDLKSVIAGLEAEMMAASEELAFERAARLRDRIRELRSLQDL